MKKNHYHAEIDCAKNGEKGYLKENTICNIEDDTYWDAQSANGAAKEVYSVQIILFVRFILRTNTKNKKSSIRERIYFLDSLWLIYWFSLIKVLSLHDNVA